MWNSVYQGWSLQDRLHFDHILYTVFIISPRSLSFSSKILDQPYTHMHNSLDPPGVLKICPKKFSWYVSLIHSKSRIWRPCKALYFSSVIKQKHKCLHSSDVMILADPRTVNIMVISINLQDQMQTTHIMLCKLPGNVQHVLRSPEKASAES